MDEFTMKDEDGNSIHYSETEEEDENEDDYDDI